MTGYFFYLNSVELVMNFAVIDGMALLVIRGFVFTAPFYQIFISICLIDVNIVRLIVKVYL